MSPTRRRQTADRTDWLPSCQPDPQGPVIGDSLAWTCVAVNSRYCQRCANGSQSLSKVRATARTHESARRITGIRRVAGSAPSASPIESPKMMRSKTGPQLRVVGATRSKSRRSTIRPCRADSLPTGTANAASGLSVGWKLNAPDLRGTGRGATFASLIAAQRSAMTLRDRNLRDARITVVPIRRPVPRWHLRIPLSHAAVTTALAETTPSPDSLRSILIQPTPKAAHDASHT
jgi:hypothetical protein